ncbi:MAG: universal stress protein [Gammaproteobacteria bacterium]|nr:universal stress protein [Gammaproteobacteria bacterium]MDH4310868.1 universal stress protein [Gammaproteobacteria bacterium]MDH5271703.1 universal stress protein [Gammaproteobacteria bacterium]
MIALTSVVVGVDFSECSRVALGHATRIASWSNATVHPVHVLETGVDEPGDEPRLTSMQREIRSGLSEEALSRWEAFSYATPCARGLPLDVCFGSRLAGIRQQLALHAADLLVLGAFGASRPNVGLGTLASGCIRGVSTDVLIVRDNYRDAFRTVAVGIDFSANSERALASAALVAHHDGARLYAVHVAPRDLDTYARLRGELGPQLQAFVKAETDRYAGLEVRCHVYPYSGHRSGILEFAALVDADLVAVGTKGHSNLRDVVLGSTAEKAVRDSVVAVWATRPAEPPAAPG